MLQPWGRQEGHAFPKKLTMQQSKEASTVCACPGTRKGREREVVKGAKH